MGSREHLGVYWGVYVVLWRRLSLGMDGLLLDRAEAALYLCWLYITFYLDYGLEFLKWR